MFLYSLYYKSSMKRIVFSFFLICFSFLVKAQNWRYSVEVGGARSLNQLAFKPVNGANITAEGRTGITGQIAFERSIKRHLSIRLATGINSNRLVRGLYVTELNDNNEVSGFGARSQEQVIIRPYMASLGIQANTSALKRIILTGTLEGTISGNTGNFDRTVTASSPVGRRAGISYGETTFPFSLPNTFVDTSPLVWGATIRIGADYRLNENTFFTVSTAYHRSFNDLKRYTDQLTTASSSYPITYSNTGNSLNFSFGLKRNMASRKPTERYNSYNAPFQRTYFAQEEQSSFPKNKWFASVAGGYWPGKLPQNLEYTSFLNAHTGYTPLPRLIVGLLVENYWIRPANFSHIYNQWLSGGPFVRYHLTGGWLSPFIEIAYQVGQRRFVADYAHTFTNSFSTYTVRPGISIWLQKHLWLDVACALRSEDERHLFNITLAPANTKPSLPGPPPSGGFSPPTIRNPYKGPLPQLGITYQFGH
ncbi:hypothetical protein CWM47_09975 [Spirosoma pollinicola]|uniref:Uncharacterized protein n=2 Tax=Spirosoma pollinicola TaxID=2057025 RepID=A0A2K8YX50_9BACT|nr:hypothetical protein CWM47_09975 [Spirosoma pollinicola]